MIRFAIFPLLLALNLSMCKDRETAAGSFSAGDFIASTG